MAHYVGLGCGRKISLGAYVRAWAQCRRLDPKTWLARGVSGWGETAAEALEQLRRGLDDRINRHDPGYGRGRKWDPDWQRHMAQAAHQINYPRLIIRSLPPDLMKIPRFRERVEYGRSVR